MTDGGRLVPRLRDVADLYDRSANTDGVLEGLLREAADALVALEREIGGSRSTDGDVQGLQGPEHLRAEQRHRSLAADNCCDQTSTQPGAGSNPADSLSFHQQAQCAHSRRAGGNDYIECFDCGLMWDYRSGTAAQQFVSNLLSALGALEQARVTLEQERDTIAKARDAVSASWLVDLNRCEAAEQALAQLCNYVQHACECAKVGPVRAIDDRQSCTCGLDKLLAAPPPAPED